MATWSGFSGSPVFLPNGHIAAVHNSAVKEENKQTKQVTYIPHGIRIDCVLEMLVYHELDGKVSFAIDKDKLNIVRWTMPDERSEKARADYSEAVKLVNEARRLIFDKQEYKEGADKCNAAIKLVPGYARAYSTRSTAFNNFYFDNDNRLAPETALKLLNSALEDAIRYAKMAPSDPSGVIRVCRVWNNIGRVSEDESYHQKALKVLEEVLTSDNLSKFDQAEAHSARGVAYDNLGEKGIALREHNEAIRLCPDEPVLWENRASYWEANGRDDLGASDRAKAREIRSKNQ
jgi:tetratricopeptide (TPR) repeat protein